MSGSWRSLAPGLMQGAGGMRAAAMCEHHVALVRCEGCGDAAHTRKRNWSRAYLEAEQRPHLLPDPRVAEF